MEAYIYGVLFERARIGVAPGLDPTELVAIEARYGVRFPPDYRALVREGVPIGGGFVDWRHGNVDAIWAQFRRPLEGICFDIAENGFWLSTWGRRPKDTADACAIAARAVAAAPVLIPLNGHRYLPATPHEADNPVFSVHQTDIIYYGRNLAEYLLNELGPALGLDKRYHVSEPIKPIPLWSDLVEAESDAPAGNDEV